MLGSAVSAQILTVLGPLLALAVHEYTEYRERGRKHADSELRYWKRRAKELGDEVIELRRAVVPIRVADLPVAIGPPFLPGEAAADAPQD